MSAVNLSSEFAKIQDHWSPEVLAQLNGQEVKIAKFKGEFVRHQHSAEDELLLVIKGSFVMKFDDREELISTGEFIVVPKGVFHQPIAEEECEVLLFEPATTVKYGDG